MYPNQLCEHNWHRPVIYVFHEEGERFPPFVKVLVVITCAKCTYTKFKVRDIMLDYATNADPQAQEVNFQAQESKTSPLAVNATGTIVTKRGRPRKVV